LGTFIRCCVSHRCSGWLPGGCALAVFSLAGIELVHLALDLIQLDEEFQRLLADGALMG